MPASERPLAAVSAPGKVLLAGGYLVTDRAYTGLVFGLDARINVVAQDIPTSEGVQLSEIVVESPQFVRGSWRYGYHLAPDDGGLTVTQLRVGATYDTNPFIETTLTYVLTYISRVCQHQQSQTLRPTRLTILADSSYYSAPDAATTDSAPDAATTEAAPAPPPGRSSRFIHMQTTLAAAKKTGLGSSAALVTALTAALLTHYLDPALHFPLASDRGRAVLHNLAQAAHCRAQGKIGSGFDVAAAVYGSCLYRRFSPSVLDAVPTPGQPGFGAQLVAVVNDDSDPKKWDTHIAKSAVSLPPGVAVRMCDVDCGSQTVGMVKSVNAWRAADPSGAAALWDELQARNDALAAVLAEGRVGDLPAALAACRELVRRMGEASGVPIEPPAQTALLDALAGVEGVYGGVVPGAGGYDAVALLVRDDEATAGRVEGFLREWSGKTGARVKLLAVRGELEGVRVEEAGEFEGWLA